MLYRVLALSLWVCSSLALSACGNDEETRAAAAEAALATRRPAYEARRASIRKVEAEAWGWKGRSGVPPLLMGQREPAQFTLEPITSAPLPGTNGRILEFDQQGSWDAPAGRLLLNDTTWLRDIDTAMGGKQGALTQGGVERAFQRFDSVRYLCLLVADTLRLPQVRSGSQVVFSLKFDPGLWQGRLLLYDLSTGELLGGRELSVSNSARVDFTVKVKEGSSVAEEERVAQAAFEADLRRNLETAVEAALETPAAPGSVSAAPAAPAAQVAANYELWLLSFGAQKLQVIKEVRQLTGLGLKDSKDLVEGAPRLVKAGLSHADAQAAEAALKAAGATVELRPATAVK